jgi:hypothetical protein
VLLMLIAQNRSRTGGDVLDNILRQHNDLRGPCAQRTGQHRGSQRKGRPR